jgi:hypothetical protein
MMTYSLLCVAQPANSGEVFRYYVLTLIILTVGFCLTGYRLGKIMALLREIRDLLRKGLDKDLRK